MSKKALLVTRVGGFIQQFALEHVKILQEMGYEVHYASNFDQAVYGKDHSPTYDSGIICHHIPFVRSPFSLETWHCYKQLKTLMEKEKFDLIHCHMPITGILTRMAAHSVCPKVPLLYTAHGFHFCKGAPLGNWLYYWPERHFARYTDCLILINNEDYERAKRFSVRGSVEYIPGIGLKPAPEPDPSFNLREHFHIPEHHKVLVSVGELNENKNHITAIKAMDRFRRDDVTYLICGTGPLSENLQQTIREMHLENQVILAGFCNNIADILRQSDIFLLPSLREGLPVSMMEAMQAGLPVLAGDIRGNRDLIEDGKGGFLFQDNLPVNYVHALKHLLQHTDVREEMGEWNKQRIKNFNDNIVKSKMREIYNGLRH